MALLSEAERLAQNQAQLFQRQQDREAARAGTRLQGTYTAPEAPGMVGTVNQDLVYGISDGGAHQNAVGPVDQFYPTASPAPAPSASTPKLAPTGLVSGAYTGTNAGTSNYTAKGGTYGSGDQMQQHWNEYWNNATPGAQGSIDFASGKLTRNADGTATYVGADGKSYTYSKDTPFATVAANSSDIASKWATDYGYGLNLTGKATAPAPTVGGSAPAPAPAPGNPAQGTFQQWAVTAPQTVEQKAAGIVGADGVLMQQARGGAMQSMNERGLVNSSLAVQAGQAAVLDRAIQMAQQDAATEAEAAKFNAGQGNAWTLAQQELAEKSSQFTRELAAKYDLAKFDLESKQALAATEREYQQQLATDKAFQDQYQMYVDALFKIDSDPELSAEAKTVRKQEQLKLLRNYASIRGLNLDQYLTFSPAASPAAAPAPAATGLVSQANADGGQ